MKKFTQEEVIHHAAALDVVQTGSHYGAYIGLDVHKETITVAVALPGRSEPEYRGEIANKPKKLN